VGSHDSRLKCSLPFLWVRLLKCRALHAPADQKKSHAKLEQVYITCIRLPRSRSTELLIFLEVKPHWVIFVGEAWAHKQIAIAKWVAPQGPGGSDDFCGHSCIAAQRNVPAAERWLLLIVLPKCTNYISGNHQCILDIFEFQVSPTPSGSTCSHTTPPRANARSSPIVGTHLKFQSLKFQI
jgi:hypothetical protein